ncbi:MAG: two-component system response regulator CreB [Desulfatiglans sp.]|jgi:two-component system catabolic regulation response regulator CreB|nr:two-component system response regulator CreB [Desulfatiglans sp.]
MKPIILIVEDEPAITDNIQYALETEGFETICFSEGKIALEYLDREAIDLIVLDIGLPDISGFELCKDIRKKTNTPIIFLTARTEEVDRIVGLEIGADDYVTKPFSPRELTARIRAVLRRTARSDENSHEQGIFDIDESRRRITYKCKPVDLSKYEFNILKTFIQRPGHVFSRDRLMDMAWEEPEASLDRTVDAHIKNIRAKLKNIDPDTDPIITHRGVGYSLRDDL